MTASLLSLDPRLVLLVAARVSGLLLLAPGLSGRSIPLKARVALATLAALTMVPTQVDAWEASAWREKVVGPSGLPLLLAALLREALVGVGLGLAARLLVVGLRNVGQFASDATGWGMAEGSETNEGASPLARLMELIGIAVFFAIGGHRQLFTVLLESYEWHPWGTFGLPESLAGGVLGLLGQTGGWVLRLSAPLIVATLAATLVAGLLQRTLPQLEAVSWSSSANSILVLAVLSLSLGMVGVLFPAELEAAWERLRPLKTSSSSEFMPSHGELDAPNAARQDGAPRRFTPAGDATHG